MTGRAATFSRLKFYKNLIKQRTAKYDIMIKSKVPKQGIVRNSLQHCNDKVQHRSMFHTQCLLMSERSDINMSDNSNMKPEELANNSPDLTNIDEELKATMKQYKKTKEEVEVRLSGKKKIARYKPGGALHVPVLLDEVLDCFRHLDNKTILDMTFGSGGHAKAILDMFPGCHIYALDRDPTAFQIAKDLQEEGAYSVTPMLGRFSDLPKLLSSEGVKLNSIGGVLMDLGASSMQFDQSERGFSLSMNGPLDMRMDMNRDESTPTAADVINSLNEADLTLILRKYGEERRAAAIAHGIVESRSAYGRIATTHQLADIVEAVCQGGYGTDRLGRISHPATKTFQALRIFVNNELNELDIGLRVAHKYLQKDGVCVAIAFHSLEEKLVKNHFYNIHVEETHEKYFQNRQYSRTRSAAIVHSVEDLTKLTERNWKPFENGAFTPRDAEIERNPRSRSAIMYAAYKNT